MFPFLIDKNKWLEMAPDTQNKYKNKLVYYILNSPEREELNKLYPRIREGEGWFGKEMAVWCMEHHEKAL